MASLAHGVRKYSLQRAEKEKRKAEALEAFCKKKRKSVDCHLFVKGAEKRSNAKKGLSDVCYVHNHYHYMLIFENV